MAGKGGVGKTTVAAALARMAAEADLTALLIELEGKPGLHRAFGGQDPLDYQESQLLGGDGPGGPRPAHHPRRRAARIPGRPRAPAHLQTPRLDGRHRRGLDRDPRHPRRPGARQGQAAGAPAGRRPDRGRRTGHRACGDVPHVRQRAARRGPLGPAAGPGSRRARDARRPGALPGPPRDAPRGDARERDHRGRLPAGRSRRRAAGTGRRELLRSTARGVERTPARRTTGPSRASTRRRSPPSSPPASSRVHRHGLQTEQVARLGRELPLPQLRLPTIWTNTVGPAELGLLSAALEREVGRLAEGPPS